MRILLEWRCLFIASVALLVTGAVLIGQDQHLAGYALACVGALAVGRLTRDFPRKAEATLDDEALRLLAERTILLACWRDWAKGLPKLRKKVVDFEKLYNETREALPDEP